MLFFNTFVSFVATIALASSVTASTTPVRRDGGGVSGSGNDCNAQGALCCTTKTDFAFAPLIDQELLAGILDPIVDALVPVGLGCALAGTAGWYCTPRLRIQLYN